MTLELHHVGCLVDSIEESVAMYTTLLAPLSVSETYTVRAQEVKVCFVEIKPGTHIELVEALSENSPILRLKKKGMSFYHCGYYTDDFQKTLDELEEKNFKLQNRFSSEAFNGRECAFLFAPDLSLFEIIDRNAAPRLKN